MHFEFGNEMAIRLEQLLKHSLSINMLSLRNSKEVIALEQKHIYPIVFTDEGIAWILLRFWQ